MIVQTDSTARPQADLLRMTGQASTARARLMPLMGYGLAAAGSVTVWIALILLWL